MSITRDTPLPPCAKGSCRNLFPHPDAAQTRLCACTPQRSVFAPFSSPSSRGHARMPCACPHEDRMRIQANAKRPEVAGTCVKRTATAFSLVRRSASRPYQDPTLLARNGIKRAMYRGRYGIDASSHTAPQPHPRARHKVPARRRRSGRICVRRV